jgi:predicted site-specific integrase-resolvase
MIHPPEAAALAGVSSRTIYRWVEEAKVHFIEESGASLWICYQSLREESVLQASCPLHPQRG